MKTVVKNSLALTLAGTMILAAASPSFARTWRYGAAAGAGFVAGTAVGAAAANAAMYGPAYQAYAYSPGQTYGTYGYGNFRSDGSDGFSGCAAVGNYGGKTDYGAC
jgi:hypothetical protein